MEGSTSTSHDVFLPINNRDLNLALIFFFFEAGFSQIISLNEVFNVRYVW